MPTLGVSVRVQISPRFSVRGEASGFFVPDNADRTFGGRFVDAAGYGTWRIRRPLSGQVGFRAIDIRHLGKANEGYGRVTGMYAGALFEF